MSIGQPWRSLAGEFTRLGLPGRPVYYNKAKNALVQLYKRRSKIGLVGSVINVETGTWVQTTSHIGGGIDSYYEYLLKSWLLFGDEECRTMWENSAAAVQRYLADTSRGGLWYGQADMETGKRTGTRFGALEAFFPAVLCLGGDVRAGAELEASCDSMWNLHGIEPEEIDYARMAVTDSMYYLRPEIIESAYYLRHFTGDSVYRQMGEAFFRSIREHCKTDAGYAYLKNVVTKEKADGMESFFFAETLKYLFLLLSPDDAFPFAGVIFTTEAHPLRRTW